MRRSLFVIKMLGAALIAAIRTVIRRLRKGPTLPSWTWSEELLHGVFRAVSAASINDLDLLRMDSRGRKPPLAKKLRAQLTVNDVDLGGVYAEHYAPTAQARGTLFYCHGGGFVTGSVGAERGLAAQTALSSHCAAFSIGYRLAPRHPYPAAIDDAITAYQSLLSRGVDPATTIFFGGSAGACLVLATALRIRDLGLPMPAGIVALWPYADFTFKGDSIVTNAQLDMLALNDFATAWGGAYVGAADPSDPLVSPALADWTGMPPLLIIAGGAETLLSCAETLATNARAANVPVQFTVYPEKIHGWMLIPHIPATIAATEEVRQWIDGILAT